MPQPTPFVRSFSFTDFSAAYPSVPQPGVHIDAEFNGVNTTLTGILTNLALIQRDDGQLRNGIVYWDAISDDAKDGLEALVEPHRVAAEAAAATAVAAAVAADDDRVSAAASAAQAAASAAAADVDAGAAAASATAAAASATGASGSATSAAASAMLADDAADSAASSAGLAGSDADGAELSRLAAEVAETNAELAQAQAAASAAAAAASETAAANSAADADAEADAAAASALVALAAAEEAGGYASGGISDTAFGPLWDGATTISPSKNAVFDKLTAMDAATAAKVPLTGENASYYYLAKGVLVGNEAGENNNISTTSIGGQNAAATAGWWLGGATASGRLDFGTWGAWGAVEFATTPYVGAVKVALEGHVHTIANVTGLQAALDAKGNLTGGNSWTGNQAVTGNVDATGAIGAPSVACTGAGGAFYVNDRDGTGTFVLYNSADSFRVHNGTSDVFTVSSAGVVGFAGGTSTGDFAVTRTGANAIIYLTKVGGNTCSIMTDGSSLFLTAPVIRNRAAGFYWNSEDGSVPYATLGLDGGVPLINALGAGYFKAGSGAIGFATMQAGSSTNAGHVAFYNAAGTRTGYIGNSDASWVYLSPEGGRGINIAGTLAVTAITLNGTDLAATLNNKAQAFAGIDSRSTSFTAADSDNNTHKPMSGASRVLTLNSTPSAGVGFTCRFTTAWTITCTSLSKNGATPVSGGSVAAGSLITFFHEGSGTWIASGSGLT